MSREESKQKADIVKSRRLDNLRELGELKTSLQSLINEGLQKNEKKKVLQENNYGSTALKSTSVNNLDVDRKLIPSTSRATSREKYNAAPSSRKESPKKSRSYNVEETREYMKKQREKRMEQLKSNIKTNTVTNDLKKQKLQELHKKSLEIITKNVEAKRERSKSRDNRPDYLRPDHTNVPKRSVSGERQDSTACRARSEERKLDVRIKQEPVKTFSNLVPQKRTSRLTERSSKSLKNPVPSSKAVYLEVPKINVFSNITIRSPVESSQVDIDSTRLNNSPREEIQVRSKSMDNRADYQRPDHTNVPKQSVSRERLTVQDTTERRARSDERKVDVGNLVPQLLNGKQESTSVTNLQTYFEQKTEKSEVAIETEPYIKETKGTQTLDQETSYPEWLQGNQTQEYPYNFINTVKRKLQYALTTPQHIDVGVQSSLKLSDCNLKDSNLVLKIKDIAQQDVRNSDLKSYISHKCNNLDPKPVEHLKLHVSDRKIYSNHKQRSIQNKTTTITNSESDTSKNIPEISSESGISLKKNAESVRFSKKNVGAGDIDKYTVDSSKSAHGRSKVSKELFTSNTSYTSDYNTESDYESGSSRSSRLSIITGNVCNYNKPDKKSSSVFTNSIPEDKSSNKTHSLTINSKSSIPKDKSYSVQGSSSKLITLPGPEYYSIPTCESTSSLMTNLSTNQDMPSNHEKDLSLLKEPQISLKLTKCNITGENVKNDTIKLSGFANLEDTNQIHLRFETEIHLLNDFNKSVDQLSAVEKAFESLKSKNESLEQKPPSVFKMPKARTPKLKSHIDISQINFSRGSDVSTLSHPSLDTTALTNWEPDRSMFSGLDMASLNSTNENGCDSLLQMSNNDHYDLLNPIGISLNLFEQLIKDEDARLHNVKTMLKIREKVLRDRVMTELSVLEAQRKTLCETGKLQEASVVKRKQRGVLLKHSEEKHEMQRLRQQHQAKSKERISKLEEKRNLIKAQLSTDKMLSKIKVNTPRARRTSGPLRVVSHSESVVSTTDDVASISSRAHSLTSIVSELDVADEREKKKTESHMAQMKRALLMREAALEKRRKEAESLLKWHKKLLDEEKRFAELEFSANAVISRVPKTPSETDEVNYECTGALLNQIWLRITGCDTKKFAEKEVYIMSQIGLNDFFKDASEHSKKSKEDIVSLTNSSIPIEEESVLENKTDKNNSIYKSDFEIESVRKIAGETEPAAPDKNTISSISDLIEDFNKIDEEMSVMSKESQNLLNDSNKILSELEETEKLSEEDAKSVNSESNVDDKVDDLKTISDNNITTSSNETQETPELSYGVLDKKEEERTSDIKTSAEEIDKTEDGVQKSKDISSMEEKEHDSLSEASQNLLSDKEILSEGSLKDSNEPFDLQSKEDLSDDSVIMEKSIEVDLETPKPESTSAKSCSAEPETVPGADSSFEEESALQTDQEPAKSSVDAEQDKESEKSEAENLSNSIQTENASSNQSICEGNSANDGSPEKSVKKESKSSSTKSEVESVQTELSSKTPSSSEKRSRSSSPVDVKKRVSEIMGDAGQLNRGDKSPRMQDLYVTTYDIVSPSASPELGSPIDDELKSLSPSKNLGAEAEELLRKQLAIEQEIKQLEQQQKELPYVLMREIPNKPPPPYTPPSSNQIVPIKTVLPSSSEEIDEIAKYSAKIIYKAYDNGNLENVSISENTLSLITKNNISKDCYKYVFDICKELAIDHYKQFEKEEGPSWLMVTRKPLLAQTLPLDLNGLENLMNNKLKELFNFKKPDVRENTIIKWSRKKRDHVDEILVLESQAEEADWTNYNKDERVVIDNVTNDIMNMLLSDTADVFKEILLKKTNFW